MSAIFKQFKNEVYEKLKQKSTSFVTLREMKICDFTIPEYYAMDQSDKWIWSIFADENKQVLVDSIDHDCQDDPDAFKDTDLIFEIANNDFNYFALNYLKDHSHKSHSDILNFLIPYTDYYDYSKFVAFSEVDNDHMDRLDRTKAEYLDCTNEIINYKSGQKSAWSILGKYHSIVSYIHDARDIISYINHTRSKKEEEDRKKRVSRTIDLCLAKNKILDMPVQTINDIPKKDIIKHIDSELSLLCKHDD